MTFKSDVTTLKPPAPAHIGRPRILSRNGRKRATPIRCTRRSPRNLTLALCRILPASCRRSGPTREIFDNVLQWLNGIDERVRAFQIRQLPPETLNASEAESARISAAPIAQAGKNHRRSRQDRSPAGAVFRDVRAGRAVSQGNSPGGRRGCVCSRCCPPPMPRRLEWCEPLDEILGQVANCESLRDMMELGLLEQGRLLKESAGAMFYDPAALVAFCRFNFLLRRAFIRMLHADLSAVRQAVGTLDASGVKSVDCRRAGFSAAETTMQLRYYCENWSSRFIRTTRKLRHPRLRTTFGLAGRLGRGLARRASLARRRPRPARNIASLASVQRGSILQAGERGMLQPAAAVQVSPANVRRRNSQAIAGRKLRPVKSIQRRRQAPTKRSSRPPTHLLRQPVRSIKTSAWNQFGSS